LGKIDAKSASFGSILSFPSRPSGFCIASNSEMRPAISSTDDTSSAISIRRMLANALISTGMSDPLGFSNSSAGPLDLTLRSANSVISRTGSTSKGMRLSSPCFSKARMNSRKSS
jgi:hypothetical protein